MSTHDLDLALSHADRIWLVAAATVVDSSPDDLVGGGVLAKAFLPARPRRRARRQLRSCRHRPAPVDAPLTILGGQTSIRNRTAGRRRIRQFGAFGRPERLTRSPAATWMRSGWRLTTRMPRPADILNPGRSCGRTPVYCITSAADSGLSRSRCRLAADLRQHEVLGVATEVADVDRPDQPAVLRLDDALVGPGQLTVVVAVEVVDDEHVRLARAAATRRARRSPRAARPRRRPWP